MLHSINSYNLNEVLHGAVIGTDFQIDDLAIDVLAQSHPVLGWLARAMDRTIRARVQQAGGILCRAALSYPDGEIPAVDEVARAYEAGAGTNGNLRLDGDVPSQAHDFVIPSVAQLLIPRSPAHLGNFVNPRASHLTGAAIAGPTSDVPAVLGLLRAMRL